MAEREYVEFWQMITSFQPSVAFYILQGKSNDWFLYEMQPWAEVG